MSIVALLSASSTHLLVVFPVSVISELYSLPISTDLINSLFARLSSKYNGQWIQLKDDGEAASH